MILSRMIELHFMLSNDSVAIIVLKCYHILIYYLHISIYGKTI